MGSTRSEAAAGVAAEFSEKLGSGLYLVHVEVVPSVFNIPEVRTEDIDYDDSLPENIEREGRQRLENQVGQVEEAGGSVANSYTAGRVTLRGRSSTSPRGSTRMPL